MNICRVIVSAMTDRIRVVGWDSTDVSKIEWAAEIFDDNKGPKVELDLYETMLRDGEAFVVIDVDQVEQTIFWYVNQRFVSVDVGGDGYGCIAWYENDDPNQHLLYVTKEWTVLGADSKLVRYRNIYKPDVIIKQYHGPKDWITTAEVPWVDAQGKPLGIAAVHFYNKGFKREAEDAFTLQDAVNKTFLDLLTTSDQAAFRIFVALGWIPTIDGKDPAEDGSNWMPIEPGRIIGTNKPKNEVSFDAVDPVDTEFIIKTVQQCILWASMVTNTPATRFISTKLIASDETLKQQEEPLVAKIDGVKTLVAYSWRQVLALTERIWNVMNPTDQVAQGKIKPIWCHSASEESLVSLLMDKQALGIPQKQLWRELGYDESKITSMIKDKEEQAKQAAANMAAVQGAKQPNVIDPNPSSDTTINQSQGGQ